VNRWKVSGMPYWSVIEEVCIYIQEFGLDILKGSEAFLDFDTILSYDGILHHVS
jgi:hypothetical protein